MSLRVQPEPKPRGSSLEWGKALWEFSPSPSGEQLNWCPRLDTVSSRLSLLLHHYIQTNVDFLWRDELDEAAEQNVSLSP